MSTTEEHFEQPITNVFNNHNEWVGFFFRFADAANWINSRAVPEVFRVERGPKDKDARPARGIYPQKGDPRLKDADEFGFVADPAWPEPKPTKGKKKSEPTVEVPLHLMSTSRSDDRLIDEAVRASLAADKTDDNTREDIGIDISGK